MFHIPRPTLIAAGVIALAASAGALSPAAMAAVAPLPTIAAHASQIRPDATPSPFSLSDGCGGAKGDVKFGSNNSVAVYGIIWENPSGCGGKQQQLWFSRTFTPGTTPVNTEIGSAGPGASNGFNKVTIPGVTSGSVTLCSTGPSGFHCWAKFNF